MTAQLRVEASGFRVDRRSGQLVQAITVTNTSDRALRGRLSLVLQQLPPGLAVRGPAPETSRAAGATPAFDLIETDAPEDGFAPGEQRRLQLRFTPLPGQRIGYRPQILHHETD